MINDTINEGQMMMLISRGCFFFNEKKLQHFSCAAGKSRWVKKWGSTAPAPKELLCGLTIRKSLRNGGRSWMRMPKDPVGFFVHPRKN